MAIRKMSERQFPCPLLLSALIFVLVLLPSASPIVLPPPSPEYKLSQPSSWRASLLVGLLAIWTSHFTATAVISWRSRKKLPSASSPKRPPSTHNPFFVPHIVTAIVFIGGLTTTTTAYQCERKLRYPKPRSQLSSQVRPIMGKAVLNDGKNADVLKTECQEGQKGGCREGRKERKTRLSEERTFGDRNQSPDTLSSGRSTPESPNTIDLNCPFCNKSFANAGNRNRHLKIHKSVRPFGCHQCNKTFSERWAFMRHVAVHLPTRPKFNCEICDSKLKSLMGLKIHMRLHRNKGSRFRCRLCNHIFGSQEERLNHTQKKHSHRITQSFKCKNCSKTFCFLSHLKIHLLVHSGERPYTCPECLGTYRYKQHYQQHFQNSPQCGLSPLMHEDFDVPLARISNSRAHGLNRTR